MGTDKALLLIDGIAMARRVADALGAAGATRVVAIGGDAKALGGIGLEVVADEWPGEGPLGGIVTALGTPNHEVEVVSVLSCDLRSPSPSSISALVDAVVADESVDVAVPMLDGHRQLDQLAIRPRQATRLREVFEAGARSIREALEDLVVVEVEGLAKAYREAGSETPVLSGADFSLARGETASMVGSSGAGKSTLLAVLAGLMLPDSGQVRFDGVAAS